LIGGQGDVSSYNKSITEEFMVPMPLHNYEDLPRSNIAPWCDYFKDLPSDKKTALLEKMWDTLTDMEQNAVIVDLRVFISEAIMAANASMLMKARGLDKPDGEAEAEGDAEEAQAQGESRVPEREKQHDKEEGEGEKGANAAAGNNEKESTTTTTEKGKKKKKGGSDSKRKS
jgi:hypothetical protein